MRDFRIDNKGTTQLFQNRFLEKLTRTYFLVPVVFYYITAIVCFTVAISLPNARFFMAVWMFFIGFLSFTLVEYLIHRFIFHFIVENEKEEKLQYAIHGVHHEFPKDKDRLVMPPVISVLIALAFYFFFSLVTSHYGMVIFAGFCAGYSSYLIIHYSIHRFKPPENFLKYLWKHHALHHYKCSNKAFSVSLPVWDLLFGTMPNHPKKLEMEREQSDNNR